ncbi:unnamed protein product [Dimorphilus gyrociliatus]|uniref:Receptor ligand binding region domain-containing protein n=1 Tax=Dimorphilus gyrociliatus TaxID=2664684 RepID=A0A7I8V616_9ANNE|nr:unnamed protein product [Dimorphilus gyrociliatus]
MAVILPRDSRNLFSIKMIAPGIELALDYANKKDILKKENVELFYRDSNCSAKLAMRAGMELYMYHGINVFFGPVFDYALVQISRFSSVWNIPTVTAGGMAFEWTTERKKSDYSLVTRSSSEISTWSLAGFFFKIFEEMQWKKAALIYDNDADLGVLNRFCYMFANSFVKKSKKKFLYLIFDQNDIEKTLTKAKNNASMKISISSIIYFSSSRFNRNPLLLLIPSFSSFLIPGISSDLLLFPPFPIVLGLSFKKLKKGQDKLIAINA